ncbi:tripartite tricarboxylate transporter substrate binding protein [Siccirubricoccus sp. G192]|uniref:Bug family tripartite tricarboxylate transporter substrate binding protein n=1 Tax=Siccirubricoccus sp. G192 TaxID=2849651 RepID=UPI001C2BEB26|nr:tripartite tricarboxylate transporter substrate binding protein [Siccirubricoccus sp. G192]MBV1796547.1 tripartite tricarboxylate transporter substrate binding protein [Siccirubricoccus sp. G192]
MIHPAAVGSAPDVAARLLAEVLARRRGHPIAVEARGGADGIIAADAFVRSPPGEAVFFTFSDVLTVAPLMHGRVPYDPDADFVPISVVADDLFAVSVGSGLPVRTLEELVALARARPGALNWFASPGTPYLAFRAFLRDAGIDMAYVSYRGAPPALLDLAAGRIHAALTPLAPALPLGREGRTRLLVATGPERAPAAPDLPTTAEAGMPGFRITGLLGLFGWRGMPDATRDALSAQTRAVLAEPATAERFRAAGMAPRGSTPAAYTAELTESRARWAVLAREFGARPPA